MKVEVESRRETIGLMAGEKREDKGQYSMYNMYLYKNFNKIDASLYT